MSVSQITKAAMLKEAPNTLQWSGSKKHAAFWNMLIQAWPKADM